MTVVLIDVHDPTPIYAQLDRGLRAAIAAGRLQPGDQLPTVRQLAVELRVNANTVARVYAELERAGILETRRGVGSFVAATAADARPAGEKARGLTAFVTRVLADAAAAGFSIGAVIGGPGLFWIAPFVDSVSSWIDQRTITTTFAAEQTLTSDTVPVNVDAVLFWMVHDAQKAALEVQDYSQAVSWAAQTALRDIIGRTALTDLLRGREQIETELQTLIDHRSNPWGITVSSVEMRDIVIPANLQDAMSREAQAAREKQARIILGEAEREIAHSFQEAAKSYQQN